MSLPRHITRTAHGFRLTSPTTRPYRFAPSESTVYLWFRKCPTTSAINGLSFEIEQTSSPEAILLTNPQLDYLTTMLPLVRLSVLDVVASPNASELDKVNLEEAVQVFQGALKQHAAAKKLAEAKEGKEDDVMMVDLLSVLTIKDEAAAEDAMVELMDGFKL
jgi:hypothetical protein